MKTPLILVLSIFVGILSSCGGGGGGSASPAIPQSTSPSAEFTPRSLSTSEVTQLRDIVSTNQKSDETLQKLKEALEVIAGRTLSADEVNTFYQFITSILSSTLPPSDECEAGRILNDEGNACRLLNSADCTAKGQILNAAGNACRPLIADCQTGQILNAEETGCRALTIADCQTGQILNEAGNACRPLTNTDCDAKGQVIKDSGDSCRAFIPADCTAKGRILNAAGNACRPLVPADCQTGQVLNNVGSACRPLTNADCEAESKILQHNSCVTPVSVPTDAECRSKNQRLNEAGSACRPLTNADCTDGKVLNTAGNACATPDPVEPEPPVEACGYYESVRDTVTGQCRPAKLEDCQAIGQVLYEGDNGTCRPLTNADCEAESKILQHNSCVTPVSVPTDAECRSKNQRLNEARNACIPLENIECDQYGHPIIAGDFRGDCHGHSRDWFNSGSATCNKIANDAWFELAHAGGGWRTEGAGGWDDLLAKHKVCVGHAQASAPTDAECRTQNNQRLNEDATACRPLIIADCQAENKVINEAGDACRPLTIADCQTGKVLNAAGSSCRALIPADCTVKGQILNAAGNACRALTADEQEYADRITKENTRLKEFGNGSAGNGGEIACKVEEVRVGFKDTDFDVNAKWYLEASEAEAAGKDCDTITEELRLRYWGATSLDGIELIALTTFTLAASGKVCNIDGVARRGGDKALVTYHFGRTNQNPDLWWKEWRTKDEGNPDWLYHIIHKNVDDECTRHFNGETAPLTPAELPDVRFAQPGDYFKWLARNYPNGFLPFANVDYASGYYHYGLQYGMNLETANFGFRATDKGAYNAMFYKSLNAGNHAFFSYDKSEDSLMVLGLDTDTDFYGKGKVRFTVSSNIINPEKKFGIGYSTNIHNSEFVGVLEYRQDSAVNVGFTLDYDL